MNPIILPLPEPFHERITPWQRNLKPIIGKNHTRYFDEKIGSIFPKKCSIFSIPVRDTYPIYNGAMGMTYEKAGGHLEDWLFAHLMEIP
ncbi:MAG: hypothetical protein Ct9H300mP9_2110 [Candidatus Neomarinimicrobiota bacterium]|nr:MAG: hypothetical protein Ct9H300mP9_2110 [Candidatus Neomarinimicrobiota bacterium]